MLESPKSLTATIHVRFHYKEVEPGPVDAGETEIMSKVLDQAAELSPELQELLVKFADYLKGLSKKPGGQSPD